MKRKASELRNSWDPEGPEARQCSGTYSFTQPAFFEDAVTSATTSEPSHWSEQLEQSRKELCKRNILVDNLILFAGLVGEEMGGFNNVLHFFKVNNMGDMHLSYTNVHNNDATSILSRVRDPYYRGHMPLPGSTSTRHPATPSYATHVQMLFEAVKLLFLCPPQHPEGKHSGMWQYIEKITDGANIRVFAVHVLFLMWATQLPCDSEGEPLAASLSPQELPHTLLDVLNLAKSKGLAHSIYMSTAELAVLTEVGTSSPSTGRIVSLLVAGDAIRLRVGGPPSSPAYAAMLFYISLCHHRNGNATMQSKVLENFKVKTRHTVDSTGRRADRTHKEMGHENSFMHFQTKVMQVIVGSRKRVWDEMDKGNIDERIGLNFPTKAFIFEPPTRQRQITTDAEADAQSDDTYSDIDDDEEYEEEEEG